MFTPQQLSMALVSAQVMDLLAGSLFADTHRGDWDKAAMDADDWSYHQAHEHIDEQGRTWMLVVRNEMVLAVWIGDRAYERHEYNEYLDAQPDGGVMLYEGGFDSMFEVDVRAAAGPQLGFWYQVPNVEDDPAKAAVLAGAAGMCVVEVDGTWGIAGTQPINDWDVATGFVNLGLLPPVQVANGLRSQADRGARADRDLPIVAACVRAFSEAQERLAFWQKKLVELWIEGE